MQAAYNSCFELCLSISAALFFANSAAFISSSLALSSASTSFRNLSCSSIRSFAFSICLACSRITFFLSKSSWRARFLFISASHSSYSSNICGVTGLENQVYNTQYGLYQKCQGLPLFIFRWISIFVTVWFFFWKAHKVIKIWSSWVFFIFGHKLPEFIKNNFIMLFGQFMTMFWKSTRPKLTEVEYKLWTYVNGYEMSW